jgi:hypothetical protein
MHGDVTMEGLDLVDRLLELSVLDGRETEVSRWLTYDDKSSILDAVNQHGQLALENVTKGGVTLYSRDLRQAVGHDAGFLSGIFLSADPPSRQKSLQYTGPAKVLLLWSDHRHAASNIPVIDSYSPFADRAKYLSPALKIATDRAIYGFEFVATIQMRMPLLALEQHGRIERCNEGRLPRLIKNQSEGIWIHKTAGFRSIGLNIDEFPMGEMASEIGPIPADGGDLLRFLILVKRIASCSTDLHEKAELMEAATILCGAGGHDFGSFMKRWGGPYAVLGKNS